MQCINILYSINKNETDENLIFLWQKWNTKANVKLIRSTIYWMSEQCSESWIAQPSASSWENYSIALQKTYLYLAPRTTLPPPYLKSVDDDVSNQGGTESESLRSLNISNYSIFSAALYLSMHLVCASDDGTSHKKSESKAICCHRTSAHGVNLV